MFPTPLHSLTEEYSWTRGLFERNVAQAIVLFCISQKYSNSGNILKLPRILF